MKIAVGARYETNQQTQNPTGPNTTISACMEAVGKMITLPVFYEDSSVSGEAMVGQLGV